MEKKKWWAAGSFNICHLVYPSMPYRRRRFVPYMMHSFINPYVIATVSFGVTRQYYGFVCYLPVESYRLYSEWTIIIETYADDLYFFLLGLYLYAFKTMKICSKLMLLLLYYPLAVLRRYWTMLWICMLPAFGILLSLCWVDYYYWELCRFDIIKNTGGLKVLVSFKIV